MLRSLFVFCSFEAAPLEVCQSQMSQFPIGSEISDVVIAAGRWLSSVNKCAACGEQRRPSFSSPLLGLVLMRSGRLAPTSSSEREANAG